MKIYTTAPMEDPRDAGQTFSPLEAIGHDGAFNFEAAGDPFLPLVLASEHTTHLRLGTACCPFADVRSPLRERIVSSVAADRLPLV